MLVQQDYDVEKHGSDGAESPPSGPPGLALIEPLVVLPAQPDAAAGIPPPSSSSSSPSPSTTTATVHNDPPPDGGLTAWLQVVSCILVNSLTWGFTSSFGVFQLHYVQTLGLPASQVSWIGSVQVFLTFGFCVFSGRLSDAGYCRQTLAAGTSLAVLGLFMATLARTYWQIFLAQGVCIGVGLGAAFMPAISVLNSYFDKRRSFALALGAVGTSVGSVSFPAAIQYLAPQIGFRWAVRCAGFIMLAMAVVANILLKPRLAPRPSGPVIEWAAFRELPYLLFSMAAFVYFYALYFGYFYINSYARNIIGFSTIESINLLLIINAMGIPARPIAGFLADKLVGPLNIFTTTTAVISILLYAWIGVTSRAGMYAFSVVYGLALGSNQGTFVSGLASMNKDPRKMGVRFGMIETVSAVATVAGPPTAGAIIDRAGGRYLWAQVWGGTVMAIAFVIFMGCRMALTRGKWRVKL